MADHVPDKLVWIRQALRDYEGRLLRYARHLLKDGARAEDVVQETFLKLWQTDRAKVEGHLSQWLFTVCRNRAIDYYRKEKVMKPLEGRELEPASGYATPLEAMEKQESKKRFEHCLSQLSDKERDVLLLKFQQHLSYREISGITGLSESNVGYLLHTALRTVQGDLAGRKL